MRLFYAIAPDDACREMLWAASLRLLESCRGRFTRRENLHLTLVFLGETERLEEARACLDAVGDCTAAIGGAFPLAFEGVGRFARRGGDVLWAGVRPSPPLLALQAGLERCVREAGFAPEERPYRPHLTLARQAHLAPGLSPEDLARMLPPCGMTANAVLLMRSERVEGVLRYTPVARREL